MKANYPQATAQQLEVIPLPRACEDPAIRQQIDGLCSDHSSVRFLVKLAPITLGSTLLLLLLVHWIGQRTRRNRSLLLKVFRVGSYMMTAVTLILMLAQAALLAATLYYGPMEFMGRILSGLIFLVALGVILALYKIVRLLFSFSSEFSVDMEGRLLSPSQAPGLWEFVRETAAAVGTEPPCNIVVGIEPTFFVTEAKAALSEGSITGRTLFVSLPLCRILTKPQLRSIVGHEMAHFHGKDTDFSRKFYPVLRNGANTVEAFVGAAQSVGGGGFAILPAISLLSFYLNSFSEAEAELSRERELAADALGASVTSNLDFAVALAKIIQHEPAWEKVFADLLEPNTEESSEPSLPSIHFARVAEQLRQASSRDEQINALEAQRLTHPTDSHPPLGVRLEALGLSVDGVFDLAGELHPEDPCSSLIPDSWALEQELLPQFAPKSERVQTLFCSWQAGFAAYERVALIRNRSFLVYIRKEGLHGMKFQGTVVSSVERYFEPAIELLNNPWFTPGTRAFRSAMEASRANFFIPAADIESVSFISDDPWGLGQIPHSGVLKIRLRNGRVRSFVLLGEVYGDGIQRYIEETCCGKPPSPEQ